MKTIIGTKADVTKELTAQVADVLAESVGVDRRVLHHAAG